MGPAHRPDMTDLTRVHRIVIAEMHAKGDIYPHIGNGSHEQSLFYIEQIRVLCPQFGKALHENDIRLIS